MSERYYKTRVIEPQHRAEVKSGENIYSITICTWRYMHTKPLSAAGDTLYVGYVLLIWNSNLCI